MPCLPIHRTQTGLNLRNSNYWFVKGFSSRLPIKGSANFPSCLNVLDYE